MPVCLKSGDCSLLRILLRLAAIYEGLALAGVPETRSTGMNDAVKGFGVMHSPMPAKRSRSRSHKTAWLTRPLAAANRRRGVRIKGTKVHWMAELLT
jgi:hypothetical protein